MGTFERVKMATSVGGGRSAILALALLTAACSPFQTKTVVRDSGPSGPVDVSHIPDAVPRYEPRTKAGNSSPYSVLGKTYQVMADDRNFKQRGIASWYGNKFHGLRTANGEIYNMYGMTAAHKTLPIPSYVRVTNLNNQRQVVVRVNDRGPFHSDRIIDLTYAAAAKLGFADRGTAPVAIEVITPDSRAKPIARTSTRTAVSSKGSETSTGSSATVAQKAPAPAVVEGFQLPDNTFLQVGAFGSRTAAEAMQQRVVAVTDYPVLIQTTTASLFRVRIGPIRDNWELANLRELLQKKQLAVPHVVYD